jgi:hypothetical protein
MEFNTIFQRIADLQNCVDGLKDSFNYTTKRLGKIRNKWVIGNGIAPY